MGWMQPQQAIQYQALEDIVSSISNHFSECPQTTYVLFLHAQFAKMLSNMAFDLEPEVAQLPSGPLEDMNQMYYKFSNDPIDYNWEKATKFMSQISAWQCYYSGNIRQFGLEVSLFVLDEEESNRKAMHDQIHFHYVPYITMFV